MTVVGVDDTDSRTLGMCTTYLAHRIGERIEAAGGTVHERLLVRLNPAVEHKTRGNAALAIHADCAPELAREVATDLIEESAVHEDDRTDPGLVVAPGDPGDVPAAVADWARTALRDHCDRAAARDLAADCGYATDDWGNGRGLIGALAAVGAEAAFEEWTHEHVVYRPEERWGTEREVDRDSVFAAADAEYPTVWDTVDRERGEAVCVPNAPGPILFGIRGDDPDACRRVAAAIDHEPAVAAATFRTNQGTDAHLQDGTVGGVADGHAYRVTGTVLGPPDTREGGHVFFAIEDGDDRLPCAAFEPTKRFRDRVRALRAGDRITACGEVGQGTLKLEKFAVRELVRTEPATPTCPDCGRSMESAGADQGYRCRDCSTTAPGKVEQPVDRDLEVGWYEVPPCARRHVARPLVRGGFDAPVHPER